MSVSYPLNKQGAIDSKKRMDFLIQKKHTVGLSPEEDQDLVDHFAFLDSVMKHFSEVWGELLNIEVGTLVEATFEDGTIYAKISEKFNGAVYMITTVDGNGSGCSIKPENIRVLSALEVFTLQVGKD